MMKKISKILVCLSLITLPLSFVQANQSTVYSWSDENGNPVFSGVKPSDDVNYKIMSVGKPTVVETQNPKKKSNEKDIKIRQSDIEKLANSKLAEENKEVLDEAQDSTYEVTIISPAEGENKFTKEEEIPVITNPAISGNDKPIFMINGSSVPGKYEGGKWLIPRPTPGENEITIKGVTKNGKDIHSSNTVTLRIFNGTQLQMKNTGNSKRAAA